MTQELDAVRARLQDHPRDELSRELLDHMVGLIEAFERVDHGAARWEHLYDSMNAPRSLDQLMRARRHLEHAARDIAAAGRELVNLPPARHESLLGEP